MSKRRPDAGDLLNPSTRVITYRPALTRLTGSITSAILAQQMWFWWDNQGCEMFYKFKEPCSHHLYREGDSWTEELGFSRHEFDSALKRIGLKKASGETIRDTIQQAKAENKCVVYWITSGRVTYYQYIPGVLKPESGTSKSQKVDIDVKPESDFRRSEITSENTHREDAVTGAPTGDPSPKQQEPVPDTTTVYEWDLEESPGEEHMCDCGYMMLLHRLPKSKCRCPECKRPVWVHAGEKTLCSPAKVKKRPSGYEPWDPCVKAFCKLAPRIGYAGLSKSTRFHWAGIIADTAGDADPETVARIIPELEVWQVGELTGPWMRRFKDPLIVALAAPSTGPVQVDRLTAISLGLEVE